MENYKVKLFWNEKEFNLVKLSGNTEVERYFTVKLLKDRLTQEYEGTVYFVITGKIKDNEIKEVIKEHLDPKYNHVDFYQIFED